MAGRILILDDVATNRIVLKVRLVQACYDVQTATTLEDGLALAQRLSPDLILFSTDLEGRGPAPILAAFQSLPTVADIPTVALASPGDAAARAAALAAGAADALSRPVQDQILLARLRALLRGGNERRSHMLDHPADTMGLHAICPPGRIALVASDRAVSAAWRRALAARLDDTLSVLEPEIALASAASPDSPDLFLISADLTQRSEGLRLMSELRARPGSRHAAFCIAFDDTSRAEAAVALDLGADEILPLDLSRNARADEAALRLRLCLLRNQQAAEERRRVAERLRDALTDPLTGLANRRAALPHLDRIASAASQSGRPYALMVIDLDHFKRVNDRHGHAAGDRVLVQAAQRLGRAFGSGSLLARMGGEEFLAVLPDCDRATAMAMAQHCCSIMGDDPMALPTRDQGLSAGQTLRVTCSIGLALPAPDEPPAQVIERADHALMAAKTGGRNRAVMSMRHLGAAQVSVA